MNFLKNETFVCVDCELTGLDIKEDRIIEVAAVSFTMDSILEEYESLVDPERSISDASLAIHRINPAMLTNKPKIKDVLPDLLSIIGDRIIIGHGIGFDIDMIQNSAKADQIPTNISNNRTIDTLRLARHYGDSPNNSLENLAKHFNVKCDGLAHRAMADVKMNIGVFRHLVRRFKNLQEVFNILSKPIRMKYMPLGKYKGRLFSEIPLQFLQWAARMDFDQDLKYTIHLELKKRKQGSQFSQASNPFLNL